MIAGPDLCLDGSGALGGRHGGIYLGLSERERSEKKCDSSHSGHPKQDALFDPRGHRFASLLRLVQNDSDGPRPARRRQRCARDFDRNTRASETPPVGLHADAHHHLTFKSSSCGPGGDSAARGGILHGAGRVAPFWGRLADGAGRARSASSMSVPSENPKGPAVNDWGAMSKGGGAGKVALLMLLGASGVRSEGSCAALDSSGRFLGSDFTGRATGVFLGPRPMCRGSLCR